MYTFTIKEDIDGAYYTLSYNGREYYIHRFTFPSRDAAACAAFDHIMLRIYWHPITGAPRYFLS